MDFDENDLRPMTGLQRPMTAVSMAGENNNNDEDFSGASKLPNPGSRPVTTKPLASGRRPSTNRPMTSMQGRPITSMTSRPTTGFVPEWMYKDEQGMERPKTGYNKQSSRQEGHEMQVVILRVGMMMLDVLNTIFSKSC